MAGQTSVARLVGDALKVVDVWTVNPDFTMGATTKDAVTGAIAELQAAHNAVETKRTDLTGLMDQRDAKAQALSELVTRARSGIRAAFGPDSAQYEQVGGTRKSERKPRRRGPNNGAPSAQQQ